MSRNSRKRKIAKLSAATGRSYTAAQRALATGAALKRSTPPTSRSMLDDFVAYWIDHAGGFDVTGPQPTGSGRAIDSLPEALESATIDEAVLAGLIDCWCYERDDETGIELWDANVPLELTVHGFMPRVAAGQYVGRLTVIDASYSPHDVEVSIVVETTASFKATIIAGSVEDFTFEGFGEG